jgi:cell division septal protein FtsQ
MTRTRVALLGALGLVLLAVPWWGPRVLRHLAYFHVRSVQVMGARFLSPRDVVSAMRVDTNTSTWDDLEPYAARVRRMAMVQHADVERELPGILVVHVTETVPVAMAPTSNGFRVYDVRAQALPIDPTKTDIDLPVIDRPDAVVTRLLSGVETMSPRFFARISTVARQGNGDLVMQLDHGVLRAGVDVTPARLTSAGLVAADLERRGEHYTELDLRYRDQIVARLQ